MTKVGIMSEKGELLGPDEIGEIVCRGDLIMSGYLDNPEETKKTIKNGWLHTGDVGVLDENGYLFIKDRIKDMIISGGFNVYPTEVEAEIAKHPAIAESIVFSNPDEKWGERIEVALKLKEGTAFDEDAFITFLKARLGSVKTPKKIHITDSLPRNAVGKVLRREARTLYTKGK